MYLGYQPSADAWVMELFNRVAGRLHELELPHSHEAALEAIRHGRVIVGGRPMSDPHAWVNPDLPVEILPGTIRRSA